MKTKISISIDTDILTKIKHICVDENKSVSQYIENLLKNNLDEKEIKKDE